MSVIPSLTTNPRTVVLMEIEKRRRLLLLDIENVRKKCLNEISVTLGLPRLEEEQATLERRLTDLHRKIQTEVDASIEGQAAELNTVIHGLDALKEAALFADISELKRLLGEVRGLYWVEPDGHK